MAARQLILFAALLGHIQLIFGQDTTDSPDSPESTFDSFESTDSPDSIESTFDSFESTDSPDSIESTFDSIESTFDFETTTFNTTEALNITNSTCCGCTTVDNQNPGCAADPVCESLVCVDNDNDQNSKCCTHKWKQQCVDVATALCTDLPECCGCLTPDGINPGCATDAACTDTVCAVDPYCCANDPGGVGTWDGVCVQTATSVCNGEELPQCCGCALVIDGVSGCAIDEECEAGICSVDPFCCANDDAGTGTWDSLCAQQAANVCNGVNPLPNATESISTTPGTSTTFTDGTIFTTQSTDFDETDETEFDETDNTFDDTDATDDDDDDDDDNVNGLREPEGGRVIQE